MSYKRKDRVFIFSGFSYLLLLIWVLLFKCNPGVSDIMFDPEFRSVSFEFCFNGKETILNSVVFAPVGFLFGVLLRCQQSEKLIASVSLIALVYSFLIELLQYVLAIGTSDLMDLLANTIGGIAGVFAFLLFRSILKAKWYSVATVLMLACTAGLCIGANLFL